MKLTNQEQTKAKTFTPKEMKQKPKDISEKKEEYWEKNWQLFEIPDQKLVLILLQGKRQFIVH